MVKQHYRWDFIGLSTDEKPTPATSEKVTDGSTFYCADNSKLYVYCNDAWYEKEAQGGYELPTASADTLGGVKVGSNLAIDSETGVLSATDTTYTAFTGTDGETAGSAGLVPAPATTDAGKFLKADGTWDTAGGGGGVTVVQTTGTSTTDVMSQNAVSGMIFRDPGTDTKVRIGAGASIVDYTTDNIAIGHNAYATAGNASIAIGSEAQAVMSGAIAIGFHARTSNQWGSIALGAYSGKDATTGQTLAKGQMHIGTSQTGYGYNSSNYRLLSGLYDPQTAHDAATKGYVDSAIINGGTTAPTTATVGSVGTLYSCVNSGTPELYMCSVADTVTPAYTWTKII